MEPPKSISLQMKTTTSGKGTMEVEEKSPVLGMYAGTGRIYCGQTHHIRTSKMSSTRSTKINHGVFSFFHIGHNGHGIWEFGRSSSARTSTHRGGRCSSSRGSRTRHCRFHRPDGECGPYWWTVEWALMKQTPGSRWSGKGRVLHAGSIVARSWAFMRQSQVVGRHRPKRPIVRGSHNRDTPDGQMVEMEWRKIPRHVHVRALPSADAPAQRQIVKMGSQTRCPDETKTTRMGSCPRCPGGKTLATMGSLEDAPVRPKRGAKGALCRCPRHVPKTASPRF